MRYFFNNIVDGYSAMVSTHGFFFINKGNKAASYSKCFYEGEPGVIDDNNKRLPVPEYVYEGDTDEFGIIYDSGCDNLKTDDAKEIIEKLLEWIKKQDFYTKRG